MAKRRSTRALKAELIDAAGGGVCPKHGEYIGCGRHRLRACPYCDIELFYKRKRGKRRQRKKPEQPALFDF